MCEWGTVSEVLLCKPRQSGRRTVKVDQCIATIVQALNLAQISTEASCCGHGKEAGRITLTDGRELLVVEPMERKCWNCCHYAYDETEPACLHPEVSKDENGDPPLAGLHRLLVPCGPGYPLFASNISVSSGGDDA